MLYGCVLKPQCILGPEKKQSKVTQCGVIRGFFWNRSPLPTLFLLITHLSHAYTACKRFLLSENSSAPTSLALLIYQIVRYCSKKSCFCDVIEGTDTPPELSQVFLLPLRAALLLPPSKHVHQGPTSLHQFKAEKKGRAVNRVQDNKLYSLSDY